MLGLIGWGKTQSGASFTRYVAMEAGTGSPLAIGYHFLSGAPTNWDFALGDTITDDNGLTDVIVSIVSATHVIGRKSYDSSHYSAWASGLCTVARGSTPNRKALVFDGLARTYDAGTGARRIVANTRGGYCASIALSGDDQYFYGTGWDSASSVVVTPAADQDELRGAFPAPVGVKTLINGSSTNRLVIAHEYVGAGSPLNISCAGEGNLTVQPGDSVYLVRDTANDVWLAQLGYVRLAELGPATETNTGDTWLGSPIYAIRISGSSWAADIILAEGVTNLIEVGGWVETSGNKYQFPATTTNSHKARVGVDLVTNPGRLRTLNAGTAFLSQPYDIWARYTK